MNIGPRLSSLKRQHVDLEAKIADEDRRPRPDSDALSRLKLEKLRLKQEMERLQTQAPAH